MAGLDKILGKKKPSMVIEVGSSTEPEDDEDDLTTLADDVGAEEAEPAAEVGDEDPVALLDGIESRLAKLRAQFG